MSAHHVESSLLFGVAFVFVFPFAAQSLADDAAPSAPSARLELEVTGDSVATRPILLLVTLTNTGDGPMSYWCGGPASYPAAQHFTITVTDASGKSQEISPTNGQFTQGSGRLKKIDPKKTVEVPLAIPPLSQGTWKLQIASHRDVDLAFLAPEKQHVAWPEISRTEPLSVVVKDDPAGASRWDDELEGNIRDHDAFSKDVATSYKIASVLERVLLSDLTSTDPTVAYAAAHTLYIHDPLPSGIDSAVTAAVTVQLEQTKTGPDGNVMAMLMGIAERHPSDKMLNAVLAVARADISSNDDEIPRRAVGALWSFRQQRATDELKALSHDKRERIREAAEKLLRQRASKDGQGK